MNWTKWCRIAAVTAALGCDQKQPSADWSGSEESTAAADPFGTDGDEAPEEPGEAVGGEDEPDATTGGAPGDDCSDGGVLDCASECWVADARDFIGDGVCDDGERGPDFNCAETDFDAGDCRTSDVDTGTGDDADDSGWSTGSDDGDTTGGSTTSGTDDGTATGTGGDADASATGGAMDDALGGCIFDGECADGFAMGECTGFGGEWVADGCPVEVAECADFEYFAGTDVTVDPGDSVYEDSVTPSCNGSPSSDVGYFWTPPTDREYCITARVNPAYASTSIAPVLSVWNAECTTELHCTAADFTDDPPTAQVRGSFTRGTDYVISLEHDLADEIGLFDLTVEPCPE